ncbi:hypothetical protein MJO47_12895 [Desulfuromonas sp. KJ2020]|uniref:DUF4292 domain-containing protein n=1 Tax=Desulfuromonas sp. KJ2020 TaxID=2919173 RepID=UPI0020A7BAA3|nr:DUF4292 domain-containing protein [Desulfuromonas sp. KJ2020]MCP3177999.1 hypothetical protein [Desulfuromonas sp. KJ2020]
MSKSNRRLMRLGLFFLFLVFLASCAPRVAFVPPPMPANIENSLLDRLRASGDYFQSLKGLAKVHVSTRDRSIRVSQVVLAEKPHSLRTEVMGPFGQTYMVLASNRDHLSVYLPHSAEFYEGKPSSENLGKFLRLPFEVEDLVKIILYQVPLVDFQRTEVSSTPEGHYRLTLYAEDQYSQEAVFSPDLRLLSSAYFRQAEKLLSVSYADFDTNLPAFPYRIGVEIPAGQTQAEVAFSEVEVNIPIAHERFKMTAPTGVTIKPLP